MQREWFGRILDSIQSEICVVGSDGAILFTNRAWSDFARANDGDQRCLVGANYFDACQAAAHAGDPVASDCITALRAILDGAIETFDIEYPCHCVAQKRWFRIHISSMTEHGARFAIVDHLDITSRIESEHRFADLEFRHRLVVRAISDGIAVTSTSGLIEDLNPAAETIFAAPLDSLRGRNLLDLLDVPPASPPASFRCRYQGGVGEDVVLQVAVHPIETAGAHLHVWTLRDISAQSRESTRRHSEVGSLERLGRSSSPPDPSHLQALSSRYRLLLDEAISAAIFGEYAQMADHCADFAAVCARLCLDPREVVRLHSSVLYAAQRSAGEARARALADEGRLLLLRILADLGGHYKQRSAAAAAAKGAPA